MRYYLLNSILYIWTGTKISSCMLIKNIDSSVIWSNPRIEETSIQSGSALSILLNQLEWLDECPKALEVYKNVIRTS